MFIFIMVIPESEEDAFLRLYEKYKRLMLRKAAAILGGNVMLAEDAVSEAFIRIYKNMDKIDNPDSGRCAAFIFTIVKNTALTIRKHEISPFNTDPESISEQPDEFDLEEQMLSKLSYERLLAILDNIGEELREVFLLKYGYDLSHKEIGKILGITENNVTVRLHRSRVKISKILIKEGIVNE